MISQLSIEKIIDAADITDVVGNFVNLKRKGTIMSGLCPFHNEKTPSFVVSPIKGIFKCFGCGKVGNSVGFIMEHEGLIYPDALRYLAKRYHIEIEDQAYDKDKTDLLKSEKESLFAALEFGKNYFKKQLHNTEQGQIIAKSYFIERGLTDQTIEKWQLGYAPNDWEHFYNNAIENQLDENILLKSGLIKQRDQIQEGQSKYYDAFRDRVIFPIHNLSGQIAGFGARLLKNDAKSAKYLNSPENEVYNKSKILFGLYFAKNEIRNKNFCYLTEGYLDVITLSQNGLENVVSSSGTSLTNEQVRLIARFTEHVVVLFDGDKAGLKAALRGIDIILENNLNVKVVTFPEGEDPDSFCKKLGGIEFENFINEHKIDFISFKTQILLNDTNGDPILKAQVIKDIVETIAKVPDPIKRSIYIQQTASMLLIDEAILIAETKRLRNKNTEKEQSSKERELEKLKITEDGIIHQKESDIDYREKALLKCMVLYHNLQMTEDQTVFDFLKTEIEEDDISFSNKIHQDILLEIFNQYQQNGLIDDYFFTNNQVTSSFSANIIADTLKYNLSVKWEEELEKIIKTEEQNYKNEVLSNLNYFKFSYLKKIINEQMELLKDNDDELKVNEIQNHILKLNQLKVELAQHYGIVVI